MLNADSSTLKRDSEVQSRKTQPIRPSVVALLVIASYDLHDVVDPLRREEALELLHQVARLLGAAGVAEHREREEDQRDRREQAEVGDHRGEVGAPVGVELRQGLLQRSPHARSIVSAVDAASALADLTEISTQVEAAVLLDESGAVLAAAPDDSDAQRAARADGRRPARRGARALRELGPHAHPARGGAPRGKRLRRPR